MIHLTKATDAAVSPHGWRQLPSGTWVTALPLVDTATGKFAHLDYETLLAVVARIAGSRIIHPDRVVELNRCGHRLKPAIRKAGPNMSSRAECDAHDDDVIAQLSQWDGSLPVANAGKPWVSGAQPGRSRLMGWSKRATSSGLGPSDFGDWYQPLQNAHNRRHTDYSSLCTLEADENLGIDVGVLELLAPFAGIGIVADVVARAVKVS